MAAMLKYFANLISCSVHQIRNKFGSDLQTIIAKGCGNHCNCLDHSHFTHPYFHDVFAMRVLTNNFACL